MSAPGDLDRACTDGALIYPEKCTDRARAQPGDVEMECQTDGYTPGSFEQPSQTCPEDCIFSRAGYPGVASMQCSSCIRDAGVDPAAAGECFPTYAVWGTRCSSADRAVIEANDPLRHPSAACWMCMTKAQLDGHREDPLAPCTNRMTEGEEERSRMAASAEQGLNRDSYCENRMLQDALDKGMRYEDRCTDSGCCHWDINKCRATESASMDECPLLRAVDLNAKSSFAVATVARTLVLVVAVLVAV